MNALRDLTSLSHRWRAAAPPEERCHFCGGAVPPEHRHVVDCELRTLACACAACIVLCQDGRRRFRAVPDRVLHDPAFVLGDELWERLGIPVRLAFLFYNSSLGRWVALYPSPAGSVEAVLEEGALDELGTATPLVAAVAADVEALVVRGQPRDGFDTFVVPIDACYRLAGRVRSTWQGLHGGDRAWEEIDAFFAELRGRASPVSAQPARNA
jgi:hypothetical protein